MLGFSHKYGAPKQVAGCALAVLQFMEVRAEERQAHV